MTLSLAASVAPEAPNIDRNATAGIRSDNVYSSDPLCMPARAMIFTGKHGHVNGVTSNNDVLAATQETVADLLENASPVYQTAIFGKWHVSTTTSGTSPADFGFDDYEVFPTSNPLGDYVDPDTDLNGSAHVSHVL